MEGFSHYLDLTNPLINTSKESYRFNLNKKNWNNVVSYCLRKADCLIVKYWAGDLNVSEEFQVSTKAYKLLEPYKLNEKPIEQGMRASFYRVDAGIEDILLKSKSPSIPTEVFDFQLLKGNELLLHSFNSGSSLFFNVNKNELTDLLQIIASEYIVKIR